jgi:hypothetical protein
MSKIESAGVWEGGKLTCGLTLVVAEERVLRCDKGGWRTASWLNGLWRAQVGSDGEAPTLRGV